MKIAIKKIFLQFITFSLILILTDCGFITNTNSFYQKYSHKECCDISNHFGHSHSYSFEDDFFINDLTTKSNNIPRNIDLIAVFSVTFKNCSSNSIWQPPKFS
jgi:hypothetical protein